MTVEDVRVNRERLWESHMEMARIGATPKGGVAWIDAGRSTSTSWDGCDASASGAISWSMPRDGTAGVPCDRTSGHLRRWWPGAARS